MDNVFDYRQANTLFCDIFSNKSRFLGLVNSIFYKKFPLRTEVEMLPLSSSIPAYHCVSGVIEDSITLFFSNQFFIDPNLPFKSMCHFSEFLADRFDIEDIENPDPLKVPTPVHFFLYDGQFPFSSEPLKLSDAFGGKSSCAELVIDPIDISYGSESLSAINNKILSEYSYLVYKMRENSPGIDPADKAVEIIIDAASRYSVLFDYMKSNQEKVIELLKLESNLYKA